MGILIYSNNGKEREERLVRAIHSLTRWHSLEIIRSVDELTKRFRQPRGDLAVMVLLAGSSKDLADLHQVKDLFFDIPMILILPDGKRETVRYGFKLIPRFVSYEDSDFEDVKYVMAKMLGHSETMHMDKTEKPNSDRDKTEKANFDQKVPQNIFIIGGREHD